MQKSLIKAPLFSHSSITHRQTPFNLFYFFLTDFSISFNKNVAISKALDQILLNPMVTLHKDKKCGVV